MSTQKNIRAYLNTNDIATTMTGYVNEERWGANSNKDVIYDNERWTIYRDLGTWLIYIECNKSFNYSYRESGTSITLRTNNEYVMADKNVWASTVWNFEDTVTSNNWWNLFQWWNNYPFEIWRTWWVSTTHIDVSDYSRENPFYSSTYIYWDLWDSSSWYKTWMEPVNKDLWWDWTNTDIARRWPCDSWYHIPTWFEWSAVMTIWLYIKWWWSNDGIIVSRPGGLGDMIKYNNSFFTDFHLPSCGWLDYQWARHSWFNYRSSSRQSWAAANAYSLSIYNDDISYSIESQNSSNAVWTYAIRPFKNL